MIEIKDLGRQLKDTTILNNINISIVPGSFTAIIGRSGSGKSTLARHMNRLIAPQTGSVTVDGLSSSDDENIFDIRERVGIVFQNPDSQAVASIVEDDTAFGPENLGLSPEETERRIEFALNETGISHLRHKPINELSGGQKQLASIAGIVAMEPKYMVFDESSSMLDPSSRKKVLDCVMRLRSELDIAVIWITHYMDEAALADRVIVMNDGEIKADGTPREIFSDHKLISECGLSVPPCAELCIKLQKAGFDIEYIPLNAEECASVIEKALKGN